MRAVYLNPFIEASYTVLREVFKFEITRGDAAICTGAITSEGAASTIEFSGDLSGSLMLLMKEDIAIKIASRMLENIEMDAITTLGNLGKASITEVANMITGRSITRLSRLGFHLSLSPPTLVLGNKVIEIKDIPYFRIPLSLSVGIVNLYVAIREGEKKYEK